ncbi:hypothetical protein RRG08_017016 [Elysia crispata]|uniref:Uncharacterized protein n=1 Tax=Elysia crispata TaxID=231223 RepID=A0AAE1CPI9_9GAST|nr:hypothetical protein RRG08_017016 [Elysia crispata]
MISRIEEPDTVIIVAAVDQIGPIVLVHSKIAATFYQLWVTQTTAVSGTPQTSIRQCCYEVGLKDGAAGFIETSGMKSCRESGGSRETGCDAWPD